VRLRRQVDHRVHAAHRRLDGRGIRDVGDHRVGDVGVGATSSARTTCPRRPSSSHSGQPTVPAEPVTRTFAIGG
jgi:hypothetical protein